MNMHSGALFLLLAGFIFIIVECVDYNPDVEQHIYSQQEKWKSQNYYHKIKLGKSDRAFWKKYCGSGSNHTHPGLKPKAVLGSRRELRCMGPNERQQYMSALNSMKNNMVGSVSEYDQFVVRHDGRVAKPAHFGPSFFPWHREFITSFERAMRSHSTSIMLPYWDSRLDKRLNGDPADSVLFSDQLMGNARGDVTTGFAANWRISTDICREIAPALRRNIDSSAASFYDDSDVSAGSGIDDYRSFAYPWTTGPEFAHGYVHSSFGQGSHMLEISCSPNDPIFFLHHSFVDLIFDRARRSLIANNNLVYPSTAAANLPPNFDDNGGHVEVDCAGNAPMLPFDNLVNSYGLLSDSYTTNIYRYERPPGSVTCSQDSDCCANGNTEFLWCYQSRCVSKVRRGGQVDSSFPSRACYCPSGLTPSIANSNCMCS